MHAIFPHPPFQRSSYPIVFPWFPLDELQKGEFQCSQPFRIIVLKKDIQSEINLISTVHRNHRTGFGRHIQSGGHQSRLIRIIGFDIPVIAEP